jgi:hypothetical protein
MVKVFNGRAATEEYMSTHSLTFSTPEMTLRKFALWLGEQVVQQESKNRTEAVPRLMLYIEDRAERDRSDLAPVVDDSFRPTGAVTDMYKSLDSASVSTENLSPPELTPLDRETLEPETKFCINCGNKLSLKARFCTKCGSAQN